MVALSLVPLRGNATKHFPHSGYLGLSPLSFQGTLRTEIHPDDRRPLPAYTIDVAVRCYETRYTKVGTVHRQRLLAEHVVTLWRARDPRQPEEVGQWDIPFRLILPVDFAGISSVNHQEYKVSWKLEGAIHHVQLFALGTRLSRAYDLNIVRYSIPPPLPPPSVYEKAPSRVLLSGEPVGPEDTFNVTLRLPLPPPHSIYQYQRVSLVLDRMLELPDGTPPCTPESSRGSLFGSVFARPSSSGAGASTPASAYDSSPPRRSPSPHRPATSPTLPSTSTRALHHSVLSSDQFLDPHSIEQTFTLAFPRDKVGHWSLGETSSTPLCTSRYFLRARVHIVSIPASAAALLPPPPVQHEELELMPAELLVISTCARDRQAALTKLSSSHRSRSPHSRALAPPYPSHHHSRSEADSPHSPPSYDSLHPGPPLPHLTPRPGPPPNHRPTLRRPRTAGSSSTPSSSRPLRPRRSQEALPTTPVLSSSPPSSSSGASSTLATPRLNLPHPSFALHSATPTPPLTNAPPTAPPSPKRSTPPTASDPPARPRKRFIPLSLSSTTRSRSRSPPHGPFPLLAPPTPVDITMNVAPEHILAWEAEVERINTATARGRVVGMQPAH